MAHVQLDFLVHLCNQGIMSVISHHFQQQRKVVAPNESIKQHLTTASSSSSTEQSSSTTAAVVAAPSISQLAKEARQGTIGWESESDEEVILRKFDMNLAFGPCTGVSRLERWERAERNGLHPPTYIKQLLEQQVFLEQSKNSNARGQTTKSGVGSHAFIHTRV